MMHRHSVRLHGPGTKQGRGSALALGHVLPFLTMGAQQALRLRIEGRSRSKGTVPSWLRKAADFEFVGFGAKTGLLEFEAPSLEDVLPKDDHPRLFHLDLNEHQSALYLLEESLDDALTMRKDSARLDEGLIHTFEEDLGRIFREIEAIEINNGRAITLNKDMLERIREFKRETPPKQWVKVAGKLEVIRHTDRAFALQMEGGCAIRGVAEGIEPEDLAGLFGKSTLVEGYAVFRPSGNLLRLEAHRIDLAQGDVGLWSQIPQPLFSAIDLRSLHEVQGPRSGLNAIIGHWPGNETDDEIEVMLRAIS